MAALSRPTSLAQYDDSDDVRTCEPCSLVQASSTLRKRLVVCCDGTFCAADKGRQNNPTNIARLTRVIANVGLDQRNRYIPQIVNYQSGVGTGWLTPANQTLQGAFGGGLDEKVCEAYTFLVNNYGPGDEIFIFGFSRGAYTARSLASFICQIGLLSPGMMDYFDEIFKAYKERDRKTEKNFEDMRWAQERVQPGELGYDTRHRSAPTRYEWIRTWAHLHAKVKVVGVFDTVGSVGMPGWQRQPGEDHDWHASKLHPKIEYAFQALALDETRGNFAPTLYYRDQACIDANVKLRQCWFPGYHSCMGGESDCNFDTNSVDEITFAWMIDQLTRYNLLQINKRALKYPKLDRLHSDSRNGHNPLPPRNPQEANERRIDWSDGALQETNTLKWCITSEIATHRWHYVRQPGEYHVRDDHGRELDSSAFKESIHPSVWHRIQNRNYGPRAMPLNRWNRVRRSDGNGFEWLKYNKSGSIQVRLPEYKIPDIPVVATDMEHWSGSLEQRIAPGDYLRALDHGNGITRGGRPVAERCDSGYGGAEDENRYLSVEKLTIRSTSPRARSRSRNRGAAKYYET